MDKINRKHLIAPMFIYLFLLFSIPNPNFLPAFLEYKGRFILFIENPSNIPAILSAIAAIGSFFAACLSFRVAKSSKEIAQNALNFQYKESINESINIIFSTLVTISQSSVAVGTVKNNISRYQLSLKRTDWIFAAQEVQSIIDDIRYLAKSEPDRKKLMERYGRILDAKLSPINAGRKVGLFTATKPNDSYIYKKISNKNKEIRNEDLFVIYLFTETFSSYKKGTGQYPSHNICNYFNKNTDFKL